MTVVLRAIELISEGRVQTYIIFNSLVNTTLMFHVMFSVFINISTTTVIALKAWCVRVCGAFGISLIMPWLMIGPARAYRKYRKFLMESGIGIRTPSQAIRILALLVKSGMIHILIGVSSALVYKHRLSDCCHDFFPFRSRA